MDLEPCSIKWYQNWKCDYESGFGNVFDQMAIGFWKCDHES